MSKPVNLRQIACGILLFATIACDIPEKPTVITVTKSKTFRPANPQDVQNIEQALAAVISAARDDLHLPVVDPLQVYLYKNTASLASYGFKFWVSRSNVAHIAATANGNKMNINLSKLNQRPWGRATWLLGHEYGHNIENEIRGSNTVYQNPWFTEGFAEWVAAKVVDSFRWRDYDLTVRHVYLQLAHRRALPKLKDLSTREGWAAFTRNPEDALAAYNLGFLAIDQLTKKWGPAKINQFIKTGDFEGSFGQTEISYEINVNDLSAIRGAPLRQTTPIHKPVWTPGDQWFYERRSLGKRTMIINEVLREDVVRGKPVFILKNDDEEDAYSKAALTLMTIMKDSKVISTRTPGNRLFSWPLESGKNWKSSYMFRDLENEEASHVERDVVIAGVEEITVPAGTFITAKIESYDKTSGGLIAEYWYAPAAKWFAKRILYGASDGFPQIDELHNFKTSSQ